MGLSYQESKGKYHIYYESYFIMDIACCIGLTRVKYHKLMVEKFNGKMDFPCNEDDDFYWEINHVHFKTQEDIENAIEWIESRMLMRKLNGFEKEIQYR